MNSELRRCDCWLNIFSSRYCSRCLSQLGEELYPRSCRFELDDKVLFAFSKYRDSMKHFVHAAKGASFQGLMPAQRNFLADLLRYWRQELDRLRIDAVCVVPGHPLRSFVHTDLAWELARLCCEELRIEQPLSLLKRKLFKGDGFWPSQKRKTKFDRERYLWEHPFYVQSVAKYQSRRILLVDDVCASQSSLRVSARELEKAGFSPVGYLVLSRVELEIERC